MPPDTPGIISAPPIIAPQQRYFKYFFQFTVKIPFVNRSPYQRNVINLNIILRKNAVIKLIEHLTSALGDLLVILGNTADHGVDMILNMRIIPGNNRNIIRNFHLQQPQSMKHLQKTVFGLDYQCCRLAGQQYGDAFQNNIIFKSRIYLHIFFQTVLLNERVKYPVAVIGRIIFLRQFSVKDTAETGNTGMPCVN